MLPRKKLTPSPSLKLPLLLLLLSLPRPSLPQSRAARPVPPSACRAAGFFRHPADCGRFYRCVETLDPLLLLRRRPRGDIRFSVFNFVCPGGTVFDETLQVNLQK